MTAHNAKHTDEQITAAWLKASEEGTPLDKLARELDMDRRGLQRRRRAIEERTGKQLPALTSRGVPGRIDQMELTHHDWSPERCLEALRAVQAEMPEKWLTARFFAHHTGIRDTTWNGHFGTFEEFCRQAGMGRTRQLSQLGKAIAKHASVDHYRAAGADRTLLGESYLRDSAGRFKVILGANDIHDIECDPFWRRVFVETARRAQPDVICLNGDIFDLPEFGKYQQDPRNWRLVERFTWVREFLRDLRAACPDAQIDVIEGNHEFRLVRLLADVNPAMMALLSDVHGMSVADLFKLNEFQVNYIAKADLAAYRVEDIKKERARNWRVYYNAVLACHFPDGKRRGLAGWNGHHHSHKVEQFTTAEGIREWHQFGAGHRTDATYCDGEKWGNGFGIWHVDTVTRATVCEYVPVTDFAVVGGRYFYRELSECWLDEQRERGAWISRA